MLPRTLARSSSTHLHAAAAGNFELPAEVLAVVEKGFHLAALHAALLKPPAHRATNVERLLDGAATDEILAADDAAAFAMARWERAGALLIAADGYFGGLSGEAFGPIREGLIVGPLREAVAAVLEDAREVSIRLKAYAPDYPTGLIVKGSMEEIEAWRESRQLQAKLDTYQRAWQASWSRATAARDWPFADLRPQRPGGYFAWLEPEAVKNQPVRVGQDREILKIAAAPSEYRLLAPSELAPLVTTMDADLGPKPAFGARHIIHREVCG